MALINCPECQESVSDTAFKCPKCGKRLRNPSRSLLGKIVKYIFIGFNLLMVWWLFGGLHDASKGMEAMSSAQQTGAAIGAGIGATMIIVIWALGDIILGTLTFFTRPKE